MAKIFISLDAKNKIEQHQLSWLMGIIKKMSACDQQTEFCIITFEQLYHLIHLKKVLTIPYYLKCNCINRSVTKLNRNTKEYVETFSTIIEGGYQIEGNFIIINAFDWPFEKTALNQ